MTSPNRSSRQKPSSRPNSGAFQRCIASSQACDIITQVASRVDLLLETESTLRQQVLDASNMASHCIAQYELWDQRTDHVPVDAADYLQIEHLLANATGTSERWLMFDPTIIRSDSEFDEFLQRDSQLSIGYDFDDSEDSGSDSEALKLRPQHAGPEAPKQEVVAPQLCHTVEEMQMALKHLDVLERQGSISIVELVRQQVYCAMQQLKSTPQQPSSQRESTLQLLQRVQALELASKLAVQALTAALSRLEEHQRQSAAYDATQQAERLVLRKQLELAQAKAEESRKQLLLHNLRNNVRSTSLSMPATSIATVHPENFVPPQGVVGVVCVKIWNSTDGTGGAWGGRLAEMRQALLIFNSMARASLAAYRGYEAVSAGDASTMVFPTAHEALAWALDLRQRLLIAPWPEQLLKLPTMGPQYAKDVSCLIHHGPRVCIGVDYGLVYGMRQGNHHRYHGCTVTVAQGLAEAALPGEVLLSKEARDALLETCTAADGKILPPTALRPADDRRLHTAGYALPVYQPLNIRLEYSQPEHIAEEDRLVLGPSLTRAPDLGRWLEAKHEAWMKMLARLGSVQPQLDASRPVHDILRAPSGPSITLMLIDIVGAGNLWRAHPEATEQIVLKYATLVRSRALKFKGWEISNHGDRFQLAFAQPEHALQCCVELQQHLSEERWPSELETPTGHPLAAPSKASGTQGHLWNGPHVRMTVVVTEVPDDIVTTTSTGTPTYDGPLFQKLHTAHSYCQGGEILITPETLRQLHGNPMLQELHLLKVDISDEKSNGQPLPWDILYQVLPIQLAERSEAIESSRQAPGSLVAGSSDLCAHWAWLQEHGQQQYQCLDELIQLVSCPPKHTSDLPEVKTIAVAVVDFDVDTETLAEDAQLLLHMLLLFDQVAADVAQKQNGCEMLRDGLRRTFVFQHPVSALNFAMELQQQLFEAPWDEALLKHDVPVQVPGGESFLRGPRVKCGLDFGPADLVHPPSPGLPFYTGPSVLNATFLCHWAAGGQICSTASIQKHATAIQVNLKEGPQVPFYPHGTMTDTYFYSPVSLEGRLQHLPFPEHRDAIWLWWCTMEAARLQAYEAEKRANAPVRAVSATSVYHKSTSVDSQHLGQFSLSLSAPQPPSSDVSPGSQKRPARQKKVHPGRPGSAPGQPWPASGRPGSAPGTKSEVSISKDKGDATPPVETHSGEDAALFFQALSPIYVMLQRMEGQESQEKDMLQQLLGKVQRDQDRQWLETSIQRCSKSRKFHHSLMMALQSLLTAVLPSPGALPVLQWDPSKSVYPTAQGPLQLPLEMKVAFKEMKVAVSSMEGIDLIRSQYMNLLQPSDQAPSPPTSPKSPSKWPARRPPFPSQRVYGCEDKATQTDITGLPPAKQPFVVKKQIHTPVPNLSKAFPKLAASTVRPANEVKRSIVALKAKFEMCQHVAEATERQMMMFHDTAGVREVNTFQSPSTSPWRRRNGGRAQFGETSCLADFDSSVKFKDSGQMDWSRMSRPQGLLVTGIRLNSRSPPRNAAGAPSSPVGAQSTTDQSTPHGGEPNFRQEDTVPLDVPPRSILVTPQANKKVFGGQRAPLLSLTNTRSAFGGGEEVEGLAPSSQPYSIAVPTLKARNRSPRRPHSAPKKVDMAVTLQTLLHSAIWDVLPVTLAGRGEPITFDGPKTYSGIQGSWPHDGVQELLAATVSLPPAPGASKQPLRPGPVCMPTGDRHLRNVFGLQNEPHAQRLHRLVSPFSPVCGQEIQNLEDSLSMDSRRPQDRSQQASNASPMSDNGPSSSGDELEAVIQQRCQQLRQRIERPATASLPLKRLPSGRKPSEPSAAFLRRPRTNSAILAATGIRPTSASLGAPQPPTPSI